LYLQRAKEIVIVGQIEDNSVQELLAETRSIYLPNKVVQLVAPEKALGDISPLLAGKKQIDGKPTAYVCENFTCSAPVTSAGELRKLLAMRSA
jgi:uncharacterized protein